MALSEPLTLWTIFGRAFWVLIDPTINIISTTELLHRTRSQERWQFDASWEFSGNVLNHLSRQKQGYSKGLRDHSYMWHTWKNWACGVKSSGGGNCCIILFFSCRHIDTPIPYHHHTAAHSPGVFPVSEFRICHSVPDPDTTQRNFKASLSLRGPGVIGTPALLQDHLSSSPSTSLFSESCSGNF